MLFTAILKLIQDSLCLDAPCLLRNVMIEGIERPKIFSIQYTFCITDLIKIICVQERRCVL